MSGREEVASQKYAAFMVVGADVAHAICPRTTVGKHNASEVADDCEYSFLFEAHGSMKHSFDALIHHPLGQCNRLNRIVLGIADR
jgi:hypothetical protein